MLRYWVILATSVALCLPAHSGGLLGDAVKVITGGTVDIEKGKVCVPPVCVQNGGVKVQNPREVVDSVLGQAVPGYVLLPQSDKDKISDAALKVGVILSATSTDPILGGIIIQLMMGDKKQEVPVPTYNPNPPPTQIKITLKATCMLQREGGHVTAAFAEDSEDLQKVALGDTVELTAPLCPGPGYISSALIIATSKATKIPDSPEGKFKFALLGKIKSN